MSMFRLVYVGCDGCGTPASDAVDNAVEARRLLPSAWVRIPRSKEAGEPARDYCPSCALTILSPDYEQEPLPFG